MFNRRKILTIAIVSVIGLVSVLCFVNLVMALEVGVEPVEEEIELGGGDIRVMIARIINVALGLLGIVALLLILYGGFLWMTAGGEAERVEKAKKVLINAVIGLAIILTSFAISQFVLNSLIEATTGPGAGPPTGRPGGGIPGGGARVFQVRSITPEGSIPIRNTTVRVLFNADVDPTTSENNITVTRVSDGTRVDGTYTTSGGRVSFVPTAACPAPNADRKCFDADTEYRVEVAEGLRSTAGLFVNCGGFGAGCSANFTTGSLVDVDDPDVTMTYPDNGMGVPVNSIVILQAEATDDAGVSVVDFELDGEYWASDGPSGPTPIDFTAEVDWDTAGYTLGTRVSIRARAFDIDDNSALSSSVNAVVRAEHCFNGVQDEGETGIDCGGEEGSPDYCGACSGGACTSNEDCSSGYCEGGVCVSLPIIESIDPVDGAVGTMVTISGQYFGVFTGQVRFLGTSAEGDEVVAPLAPCSRNWTNNQIIITVPEGAVSGPIEVTTNDGDIDVTNNDRGPSVPDFLINTTERPGICEVSPEEGETGTLVTISGTGFGTTEDQVRFAEIDAGRIDSWAESSIGATVPPLAPGEYPLRVSVGGVDSNAIEFEVVEAGLGGTPIIAQIDPGSGPIGEYVTILGSNFGSSVGRVTFTNPSTGQSAVADVDFPEECGDDFWYRDNITVKVPDEYSDTNPVTLGVHEVRVQRSDGRSSAGVDFTINDEALAPGICRLVPNVGPIGTEVTIFGERLGSSPGAVTFYNARGADVLDWSDDEVLTEVPSGAETGPVTVTSAAGAPSNGLSYRVENCLEEPSACEVDQQCCSDGTCLALTAECAIGPQEASFVWRFSTGIIPITPQVIEACASEDLPASPSPWSGRAGGDSVCVNAVPTVRFNVPMDITRFNSSNIEFKKCVGGTEDPCSATVDVLVRSILPISDNHGFQILPDTLMDPDSTYLINLSTNLRGDESVGSLNMEEDEDCGTDYGYCFDWKTRVTTEPCVIGGVSVTPSYKIAKDNEPIGYTASAIAGGDICIAIDPSAYDWLWDSSDVLKASVAVPDSAEPWQAAVTPISETRGDPVQIAAEAVGQGLSDFGELVIDFTDPTVISHEPDCTEACLNAVVRIGFNTLMDSASLLTPGNIEIRKCENENCRSFAGGNLATSITAVDTSTWQDVIVNHDPFEARTYYRVILSDNIQSYTHTNLTGLNWGDNYSWTFRTKDSVELCVVNRVEIEPLVGFTEAQGERVSYTAIPYGEIDECSTQGQVLDSEAYDWGWSVGDTDVAMLLDGGTLDTSRDSVSSWCNHETCLRLGSEADIAVCGNGTLEITLGEECDDGNTTSGDGCSPRCLTEPVAQVGVGGTCGNALIDDPSYISPWDNPWIEGNEECDDGNDIWGDGCSDGCMNEGATLAGSTCGNGDLGDGEDCDDANRSSGDGCSPECLREGSEPGPLGVCGNGTVQTDLGEDCDDGNSTSGDGCSSICLNEGSYPCVDPSDPNCCGNARIEFGEDCDGGEGCGLNCLLKGSSYLYSTPSFCGDGAVGTGEESGCEIGAPDGRADAVQIAEAVGMGVVDEDGNQTTSIMATADGVTGEAEFTLLCGFTLDAECKAIDPNLGLAANSCCYPMPEVVSVIPANDSNDMCRNSAIKVTFSEPLSRESLRYQDGEVTKNRILVIAGQTAACGEGESQYPMFRLTYNDEDLPWWKILWYGIKDIFARAFARVAHAIADTGIDPRRDLNYCESNIVDGSPVLSEDGSVVQYQINQVLESDTWYQIRVLPGVATQAGVELDTYYASVFGTGTEICALDYVYISDPAGNYFFDQADPATLQDPYGERSFVALAVSRRSGKPPVAIAETPGLYEWEWSWTSSEADGEEGNIVSVGTGDREDQLVTPAGNNGEEQVSAQARITQDKIFGKACSLNSDCPRNLCVGATETEAGNCAGEVISDSVTAVVNLCENPWPDPGAESVLGVCMVPIIEGPLARGGSCRNDDDCPGRGWCDYSGETLPYFADPDQYHFATMYCRDREVGLLPDMEVNLVERIPGVLQDYLLTYVTPDPEASWARDGIGFRIMPNPDHLSAEEWYRAQGFGGDPEPILVDGYSAVRVGRSVYINAANKFGDPALYTNVYILSYSDGAHEITQNIYNQLLQNLIFNYDNVTNERVCRDRFGDYVHDEGGAIVMCTANLDCLSYDENASCDADKDKLQRDLERITILSELEKTLENYRAFTGGRKSCALDGADLDYPCVDDADCEFLDSRAICEIFGGTVPNLESGSYLRTLSTSLWPSWQTELGSAIGETITTDPINQFADCQREGFNYDPSTCFDAEALQFFCPRDSLVYQYRSISGGSDFELLASLEFPNYWTSASLPEHVRWDEGCEDTVFSNDDLCGDGLKGPGEECELGEIMREGCGGAMVRYISCVQDGATCRWARSGEDGYGECQDSVPVCGNGVREGFCVSGPNMDLVCRSDLDCPDSTCFLTEPCDDGANNGLYGFCNNECTADGAYCGDGLLAGAEECDEGEDNGQYDSGCSWDCRVPGPMCGDGVRQPEEDCEQDESETSPRGVCTSGALRLTGLCDSDEDCPSKKIYDEFSGAFLYSEPGICSGACVPADGYDTQRSRTCSTSCDWGYWQTSCSRVGVCGDGILQGGEECDDGNTNNTDGCVIVAGHEEDLSISCKIARCGDGYRYSGVESCDAGLMNGVECEAEYGGTCEFCTERCTFATATGAYCGDGIRQSAYEECDEGPIACWYTAIRHLPEGVFALGIPGYYGAPRSCDPYGDSSECTICPEGEEGEFVICSTGVCQGQGISLDHVPAIPPDPPMDYGYNEPYCDTSCHVTRRTEGPRCGDGVVDSRPYPPLPWTREGADFWGIGTGGLGGTIIRAEQSLWWDLLVLAGRTFMPSPIYITLEKGATYLGNFQKYTHVAYGVTWTPVFEPCESDEQCPDEQICDQFGDDPQNYCYTCSDPIARSGCVKTLEDSGEVCDSGYGNGVYSSSIPPNCNNDCSAYASFCGDGIVDLANNESCDWGDNNFEGRVDLVFVTTMPDTTRSDDGKCSVYDGAEMVCDNLSATLSRFGTMYDIEKTFYLANADHEGIYTGQVDTFRNCFDNMIREGALTEDDGTTIESYAGLAAHPDICSASWASDLGGCSGGLFTRPSGATSWTQAVADIAASHRWRSDSLRYIVVVDNNLPNGPGSSTAHSWAGDDGRALTALQTYFNTLSPEVRPRLAVLVHKHENDYACIFEDYGLSDIWFNRDRFSEAMRSVLWADDWGMGAKHIFYGSKVNPPYNTYPVYMALDDIMNSIFCDVNADGITDCSCLAPPAEGATTPWCL